MPGPPLSSRSSPEVTRRRCRRQGLARGAGRCRLTRRMRWGEDAAWLVTMVLALAAAHRRTRLVARRPGAEQPHGRVRAGGKPARRGSRVSRRGHVRSQGSRRAPVVITVDLGKLPNRRRQRDQMAVVASSWPPERPAMARYATRKFAARGGDATRSRPTYAQGRHTAADAPGDDQHQGRGGARAGRGELDRTGFRRRVRPVPARGSGRADGPCAST